MSPAYWQARREHLKREYGWVVQAICWPNPDRFWVHTVHRPKQRVECVLTMNLGKHTFTIARWRRR